MLPLPAMAEMAKLRSFLFLGFAFFTNVNRRTHYFGPLRECQSTVDNMRNRTNLR